jgi:hypothetical protein
VPQGLAEPLTLPELLSLAELAGSVARSGPAGEFAWAACQATSMPPVLARLPALPAVARLPALPALPVLAGQRVFAALPVLAEEPLA